MLYRMWYSIILQFKHRLHNLSPREIVKNMIQPEVTLFNTASREIVTLQASPTDTIVILKSKVKELLGYPINSQKLLLSGRLVEDSTPVGEVTSQSQTRLYLALNSGYFYVTFRIEGGMNSTVRVPPYVRVQEFREILKDRGLLPCSMVNALVFHKHRSLGDNDIISERDLARESVVYLFEKELTPKLIIFWHGHRKLRFSFDPSDRVESLIRRFGFAMPLRFTHRGRLLEGSMTFAHYGITTDSIIIAKTSDEQRPDEELSGSRDYDA